MLDLKTKTFKSSYSEITSFPLKLYFVAYFTMVCRQFVKFDIWEVFIYSKVRQKRALCFDDVRLTLPYSHCRLGKL